MTITNNDDRDIKRETPRKIWYMVYTCKIWVNQDVWLCTKNC